MEHTFDIKARKQSEVGESNELYLDVQLSIHTENTLFINHKEKYLYQKVRVEENKYKEERISNFIIEPLYMTVNRDGNQIYILKLTSSSTSKVIKLDGETLAIKGAFKKHCLNQGKFNWTGNQYQLDKIVDFILGSISKEIIIVPYIGWYSTEKTWFFPTHAYCGGEIYIPDKNGVFDINGKYFMIQVEEDDEYTIHPHVNAEPSKEEIIKYFLDLRRLYKDYMFLVFGYMASSFNVDAIAEKTDYFPFLYAYGKQGQGKSALISLFSKLSGMKVSLTNPPTLDGLRKGISGRSNVPFVVDEAEDKSDKYGVDFFKSLADVLKVIYMRATLIRGHKDETKKVRFPIRGTLCLGGEVLTSVTSIIQRSVLIDSSKILKNEEIYNQVKQNDVAYWIGQFLMRTSHEWKNMLLELYEEIMNYFTKQGLSYIHVRIRSNYAIFLAGAFAAFKQLNKYFNESVFLPSEDEIKELYCFVFKEMKETQRLTEEDHPSMKFLTKIGLLANNKVLRNNVDYKCVKQQDGNIYLYLAPTNIIEAYKSYEKNPYYSSSNKAVKDLQNQAFFKGFHKTRIGQSQPNSWVIQLTNPTNPELIKEGIIHPDLPDPMVYFY